MQTWHWIGLLALPAISLFAGVAALFIDPKTDRNKIWILILLMAGGALASIAAAFSDDKSKESLADTVNIDSQSIHLQMESIQALSGKADNILAVLSRNGFSQADTSRIAQSISADASRSALLPKVAGGNATRTVTVQYYPKDVDPPVVFDALKQGGFQVKQGNPTLAAVATNAIWAGDSVTLDQAKFVALTLVRAGVPIAALGRIKNDPKAKAHWIEVGASQAVAAEKLPPLTVDRINAMKEIPNRGSEDAEHSPAEN